MTSFDWWSKPRIWGFDAVDLTIIGTVLAFLFLVFSGCLSTCYVEIHIKSSDTREIMGDKQ